MDVSGMTEEEQLEAAMRLSLGEAPVARGAGAPAPSPVAPVMPAAPVAPPAKRVFPAKDPADVLSPPGELGKRPRVDAPGGGRLDDTEVAELMHLVFGDTPEDADVSRWFDCGFQFSSDETTPWGLWQTKGGPCGVFAPLQAFLLKHLLFTGPALEGAGDGQDRLWRSSPSERLGALVYALATVLFHSTPRSSYVVCRVSRPTAEGGEPGAIVMECSRFGRVDDAQQCIAEGLLTEGPEAWLRNPCGVISFVCSVLLSRTPSVIREDMDDPTTPLIGRFGHCSQELVNLVLIGEATSNVFDGSKWLCDDPSSGMMLKGVESDRVGVPTVGYLSELEPMRYIKVGTLYKYPEFPFWVLGSPTHYTLLFSTCRADSQLSEAAALEQRARKSFNDNALDDSGMALGPSLGKMLEALGVPREDLAAAERELVHEEVFIWEDFWAWVRRKFGIADSPRGQAVKTIRLYLYDGQDPPGPTLRSVLVELSDIDPSLAGGEGDAFAATMQTRWPNAVVTVEAAPTVATRTTAEPEAASRLATPAASPDNEAGAADGNVSGSGGTPGGGPSAEEMRAARLARFG